MFDGCVSIYNKLMKEEVEDKRYDKVFGGARLLFLLMHLIVILSNFNDQVFRVLCRAATSLSIFQKWAWGLLRPNR